MIEVQRPLSVLGLADGASEADIRRAYAQRLKVTHPEDDPEGFKQLRWAYEAALNEARWRVQYGDDEPAGDEGEGPAETDAEIFEEALESTDAEAAPVTFARMAEGASRSGEETEHAAICNRLGDALQTGTDLAALHQALDAVLASPALSNVDVYNRTESWMVYLLTSSAPKSYPLLDRVIAHFQWDKRVADHRNTGPAAVVALRDRIPGEKAAADFLARVDDRRHEFNRAYKETMRDPYGRNWLSRFWSLRRYALVERFILYIDRRFPLAIEQLNADAVFWWRNVRRGPLRWVLGLAAIAQTGLSVAMVAAGGYLVLNGLDIFGPSEKAAETAWRGTRAECERAMTDLKSEDSASQIDTILERAWSLCRRELAAAPDSLGLSQHVGVLALAAGRTEDALAQFDAILALSPNDPYALFGKGLAASDAALLGEAARRDGEAMTYFMDFPVRVPAPTPMEEEPKSRWEKRPNPKFDTRAKKISEPSDEQMEDLLEHFGRRRTPVGEALLNCLVGSGGGVSDCVIVDEAPFNQGVGEFALRMAMLSKFEPARLNGEPVDRVPVNYKIRLVDANGEAPNVRTGSLGELIEGLTKETREKKAAAPSAASEPDSAPRRAGTPVPRVLNEETRRMLARTDCEVMFEEMRSPKDGQDIGDRMARADSFCRRELEKAPDSLMLRQHVAIVALAAGKPAEAAQAFDEILALSPNDPYALYGRGIAAFNLDASADLSMMAEAQKREPEVRAYFSKLLVTIPDVAPQEEEPKSRHERRPVPAYDTRTKQLSDPTDQQMRDLLMHFGVRRTPVGEAQLNCLVGADGSVFECVVIKETPFNQGVGEFAIRIAMASKFEPATLNGEAVDRVPLNYTLSLVEDPESLTPK